MDSSAYRMRPSAEYMWDNSWNHPSILNQDEHLWKIQSVPVVEGPHSLRQVSSPRQATYLEEQPAAPSPPTVNALTHVQHFHGCRESHALMQPDVMYRYHEHRSGRLPPFNRFSPSQQRDNESIARYNLDQAHVSASLNEIGPELGVTSPVLPKSVGAEKEIGQGTASFAMSFNEESQEPNDVALPLVEPKFPKRPLNSYNIFFCHERARFLVLHERGQNIEDHPPFLLTFESVKDLLENNPHFIDRKKRRHRKSHGAVSFTKLTEIVSKSWQAMDEKSKKPFLEVAGELRIKYDADVKMYHEKKAQFDEALKRAGKRKQPPKSKKGKSKAELSQEMRDHREMYPGHIVKRRKMTMESPLPPSNMEPRLVTPPGTEASYLQDGLSQGSWNVPPMLLAPALHSSGVDQAKRSVVRAAFEALELDSDMMAERERERLRRQQERLQAGQARSTALGQFPAGSMPQLSSALPSFKGVQHPTSTIIADRKETSFASAEKNKDDESQRQVPDGVCSDKSIRHSKMPVSRTQSETPSKLSRMQELPLDHQQSFNHQSGFFLPDDTSFVAKELSQSQEQSTANSLLLLSQQGVEGAQ